ncbi:hypothetical protein BOX15_Mlig031505g1 [Macrostomum lignano]|uniref:Fibrinogen C-terminal domain-containing protein n=1 Tax=Macrostomum lignano TaxID=282301 RepID=A0A267F843_9PLAT|nr:hypothetical protein BOX15_Mlig031505g1 [Macrostomum lignano]
MFGQKPCQSEADCAIICAQAPSCVKFGFLAAHRLCRLSHMTHALSPGRSWVDPVRASRIQSLCPLVTAGGRRFCVFQRRVDSTVAFDQPWRMYEIGFGNQQNWWIGLQLLHQFTQPSGKQLRVEVSLLNGESHHFEYSGFLVANSSSGYVMTYGRLLDELSSSANDSLAAHRDMKFSTRDRDNDLLADASCSEADGLAGWWYSDCYRCNPNGILGDGAAANGSEEAVGEEAGVAMWFAASESQPLVSVRLLLQV